MPSLRIRVYLGPSVIKNSVVLALATALTAVVGFADNETAVSNKAANLPPLVFETATRVVEVGYYPREFFVDFLFEARGKGAVSIRNFSSTCPCTTVAAERTVYYPGQKGLVAVIYSYRGDSAPDVQVVRVTTDQSPRPQLLQILPRRPDGGLWVERQELRWAGAPSRLAQQVQVEVAPELQGRTPIVELKSTGWQASVEPLEPAGRFRITVQPTTDQSPAARALIRLTQDGKIGGIPGPNPEVGIALFPAPPSPPAAP